MNQHITIAEFKPGTRGPYILRFQVVEVSHNQSNPDEITCMVADQTGCIDAYLSRHGKHIKNGQVYQLEGLKCKVVDHHLRLQLVKESKLTRVKYDMAFKDLVNDMSEKFYVSKAEQEVFNSKIVQKSEENGNLPVQKEKEKSQQQKNSKQSKPQQENQLNKQEETKRNINQEKQINNHQLRDKNDRQRQSSKNTKQSNHKKDNKQEEEKPKKKKYIAKKEEEKKQQQPKQRVYLKDIYLYREQDVNLFVQIHINTTEAAGNYMLVKAADKSGSAYLEFDRRAQLEDRTWYCLRRFRVFGDKKYGCIASQQEYSTFDILGDYDEVPERSPIYFPKPK